METRIELDITESELLNLIMRYSGKPNYQVAGLSAREIRNLTGLGEKPLQKVLWRLVNDGILQCVKGHRAYVDGRSGVTPIYCLANTVTDNVHITNSNVNQSNIDQSNVNQSNIDQSNILDYMNGIK